MITMIAFLSSSLILNIILGKINVGKSNSIFEEKKRAAELEKKNEMLFLEVEKNKEIYSNDRRALIAENENYLVQLESCQNKLKNYSKERSLYYSEMDNLNNHSREMPPEEFLSLAKEVSKKDSNLHDFTGIYILENKTHDKFYVGQSISLFKRVSNHFTGKGNKDVFEDYQNGDIWTIRLIALSDSGFRSINALEKHFIEYHHSTYNGYNKTIGNIN